MESNTDYKTEIPTPEDLKLLEEIKKYKGLHASLTQQPEYLIGKIDKIIRAIYS